MMKTRFFLTAAAMAALMPLAAQETYENAKIATEDLNGTARYVGMGGAGDALGADISTISTKPGWYRTLPTQQGRCLCGNGESARRYRL